MVFEFIGESSGRSQRRHRSSTRPPSRNPSPPSSFLTSRASLVAPFTVIIIIILFLLLQACPLFITPPCRFQAHLLLFVARLSSFRCSCLSTPFCCFRCSIPFLIVLICRLSEPQKSHNGAAVEETYDQSGIYRSNLSAGGKRVLFLFYHAVVCIHSNHLLTI